MKLLYTTMYSALLMGAIGLNATAQQQLPNSGFEGEWTECIPWITNNANTTVVTMTVDKVKYTGYQPSDWCISDVIGIGGLGATIVGTQVEGYNSAKAVKLTNTPNPFRATQIVPAYIALGTTWSTAKASLTGVSDSDGGTFEGMNFTSRPKGLEFMYKRSRGTDKPNEQSTIVAYLWKGHWTQANVPGDIKLGKNPTKADMIDRDRCVLEMSMDGCQGGAVTNEGGVLIGKLEATITENTDEWTKFSADFEYFTDDTPENINVIIAAGDYFGGSDVVGKDNSLTIDNVRLFYEHEGDLSITMGEETMKSEAAIQIIPNGDSTCTFTLPNFILKLGEEELLVGDIVVDNVTITEKDGTNYYEGTVNKLELMGGAITAHVSLSGTLENMKIDVIWLSNSEDPTDPENMPIYVEFKKKPDQTTGITDITVDNSNAPVEFYNLQGIRVNGDNLTPGIYVRRQGSAVSKILVK